MAQKQPIIFDWKSRRFRRGGKFVSHALGMKSSTAREKYYKRFPSRRPKKKPKKRKVQARPIDDFFPGLVDGVQTLEPGFVVVPADREFFDQPFDESSLFTEYDEYDNDFMMDEFEAVDLDVHADDKYKTD